MNPHPSPDPAPSPSRLQPAVASILVTLAVVALALAGGSSAAASKRPVLLPACVYGESSPGLDGYRSRVQHDAWSYADGLEDVTSSEREEAARVFAAAEAAYVYGLPLVKLHDTVRKFRFRNTIVSVAALADAESRGVVSPNVDTAYTVGWFSLTQGPLVIDVPDTAGRFYTFQFMDAFTNSFTYVGSGATGTSAGSFVLAPPGWSGDAPAGTQVLRSPTNTVWLLGRTLVQGPADMERVRPLLEKYTATPLEAWRSGARGRSIVLDRQPSQPASETPTGTDFIATLNRDLTIDPPPEAEGCVLRALAPAGVETPDDSPAAVQAADATDVIGNPRGSTASTPANDAVAAGTAAAERLVDDAAARYSDVASRGHEGWSVMVDDWIGDFGANFLGRGVIATNLLGANVPEVAVYPTSYADSHGRTLTGRHRYTITFPAGGLPPVKAFWSLTMYRQDNFLYDNPIDRYAINDRTRGLHFDRDGSLTLYVQHDRPEGRDERANWLPAPRGRFHLIMRLYQPRDAMLDGRYELPPFVEVPSRGR